MRSRFVAIASLAVLTIAVAAAIFYLVPRRSREDLLIATFPALRAGVEIPQRGPNDRLMIPDPFLRPPSTTRGDHVYDTAIMALLNAQLELRKQEDLAFAHDDPFPTAAVKEARIKRDTLAQAADEARQAPGANPDTYNDAYRGVLVQRNTILLHIRDDANIKDVKKFLDRERLDVVSGTAAFGILAVASTVEPVEPTTEGDSTRLRAIIERLRERTELFDAATQNSLLGPDIIPQPAKIANGRNWFTDNVRYIDPLVISNFPAAWNFNAVIKRAITAGTSANVVVGILDEAFAENLCVQRPCDVDVSFVCNNETTPAHGTLVASIIGASFDDGLGIDGATPFAVLKGCSPPAAPPCDPRIVDCDIKTRSDLFDGFITGLAMLFAQGGAKVVNASVSYKWPFDPATNSDAMKLAASQGIMVRTAMATYNDRMLVSSAGNDSNQAASIVRQAVWASPFNWAALGPSQGGYAAADNIVVVEAMQGDGDHPLSMSNAGASIRAVGEGVLGMRNGSYGVANGTSVAAPLVTATIATMLARDKSLIVGEIKRALIPGDRKLNAFNAMRISAGAQSDIELADLVAPFGQVDEADFANFKDGYDQICGHQVSGTKIVSDLNCDGQIDENETKFCRIDLNGDGKVTESDLEVMIKGWSSTLTGAQAADLRRRLVDRCHM